MNPEPLRQVVYISRASRAISPAELRDIASRSETRNRSADIGGALFSGSGLFLQALEGEDHALTAVLERIARDPRHSDLRTLVDHSVESRSFRKWAMTPVSLDQRTTWTPDHLVAIERMAGIASVSKPGSAAHALIGAFLKHVPRLSLA